MKKKQKIYWIFIGLLSIVLLAVLTIIHQFKGREKESDMRYDRPDGYSDYYKRITIPIGESKSPYTPNYQYFELEKAKAQISNLKAATANKLQWIQRGPGNVSGRTRAVIIDPDDASHKTWYAAAVSGGVWRTKDAGVSWSCLTDGDLGNLATTCLVMAPSNTNLLYAGTGEGFGGEGMVTGSGIYVSSNRGGSWEPIESTSQSDDFRYVNKLIVHPTNEKIVLAATNTGIFKTTDAGQSWEAVYKKGYAIQDFAANPKNHNVLYAGANSFGIIKSVDFGESWFESLEGIGTGYRFSVAVSPVDTAVVLSSVEAPNSQMDVYYSSNSGVLWSKQKSSDGSFQSVFGNQGWFNNVVAAHPFDKTKFYIAGVNFASIEVLRGTGISEEQVIRVDTIGTGSYMIFVNFGGDFLRGGMTTGLEEDAEVEPEDYVSVEIRFGNGISQKAHRFTVPEGEGAGVPVSDYSYRDYVEVPFQVWDVENNIQLAASFRDQNHNGKFDLVERKYGDDISGREYLYVNAFQYNATVPQVQITTVGGHYQKMLYFLWPGLAEDAAWNPDNLPSSKIKIKYGQFVERDVSMKILADNRLNKDLHVDHHDIKIRITDEVNKKFVILEGNDGGLGFSEDGGLSWKQIKDGYISTQFYGIAKRTGAHEYIGGMQDNGTWQSPKNSPAYVNSDYEFRIAGDGFEALWHPKYSHRILGSSYNNAIKISNDYGETWKWTTEGINGDGPFVTKLSHSRDNPDLVFAVGSKGIFKHSNFGLGIYPWQLVSLGDGWSVDNTVTSSHNVKVSKANPKVVWTGGGMFSNPDLKVFVSKDYGQKFDSVTNYTKVELGYISGMSTHPTVDSCAYLLFSYRYKPKILRTRNWGKTWEDLSGFEQDSFAVKFPDVQVYDLCVMPYDTSHILVGTEIGIFESYNNGLSWGLRQDFPSVSVWQIMVQDDNLIVATHGRGIWSAPIDGSSPVLRTPKSKVSSRIYPNPATQFAYVELTGDYTGLVEIFVYSVSGKQLKSIQIDKSNHQTLGRLDVSDLNSGTYLVRVNIGTEFFTQKLIVR